MTAVIPAVIVCIFLLLPSHSIQFAFNHVSEKKTTFITCIRQNCQVHSDICRCHFCLKERKQSGERAKQKLQPFMPCFNCAAKTTKGNTKRRRKKHRHKAIELLTVIAVLMKWAKKKWVFSRSEVDSHRHKSVYFCILLSNHRCVWQICTLFLSLLLHLSCWLHEKLKLKLIWNWKWKTQRIVRNILRTTLLLLLQFLLKIERFVRDNTSW